MGLPSIVCLGGSVNVLDGSNLSFLLLLDSLLSVEDACFCLSSESVE